MGTGSRRSSDRGLEPSLHRESLAPRRCSGLFHTPYFVVAVDVIRIRPGSSEFSVQASFVVKVLEDKLLQFRSIRGEDNSLLAGIVVRGNHDVPDGFGVSWQGHL